MARCCLEKDDTLSERTNLTIDSITTLLEFCLKVTYLKYHGTLPYLDVLLHHNEDGSIGTSVYRKPTHMDKYLEFSSHHLLQHKNLISVISTLFTKAYTLLSSLVQRKTGCHPSSQARKHSRPQEHIPDQPDQSAERNPTPFISLPYIQRVSESIRRVLSHYTPTPLSNRC